MRGLGPGTGITSSAEMTGARLAGEEVVAEVSFASPSGVGRLSRLGGMRDGSVFTAVMRSVHKFSYGHKFERSAATPVVA